MPGKELAALRQRHRVRMGLLDVAEGHSSPGNQHVADAKVHLRFYPEAMLEQEIVIFVHRAGESIFDGHQAAVRAPAAHQGKCGDECGAGQHGGLRPQEFCRRFFAEGAALALYGQPQSLHGFLTSGQRHAALKCGATKAPAVAA